MFPPFTIGKNTALSITPDKCRLIILFSALQTPTSAKSARILNKSFLFIAFLSVVAASFPLITTYFEWLYVGGIRSGALQTFIYSIIFLSAGPFLFGFNTTLLSRCLCMFDSKCTGRIMAWDTIG